MIKLIILGLILSVKSYGFSKECWENFKIQTAQQMQERELKYQSQDRHFTEISDLSRAYTQDGTNDEIVILIHGFLASPNEVRSIADRVHEMGYNVYSALIPGYGATAKVANKYKKEDWILWTKNEILRAEECFSKIHLIGFSTGGILFHDYVSKNPEDKKIASLTMISAFFKTHFTFNMILKLVKWSQAKEVKMSAFFEHLPVSDVQVILDNPQTYLQKAPMLSMQEIISIGKENKNRKISKRSLTVPTLAIISEEDMVADHDTTEKVVKRNFKNLEIVKFEEPGHVPHQIMDYSVSRVAGKVHQHVVDFLDKNRN